MDSLEQQPIVAAIDHLARVLAAWRHPAAVVGGMAIVARVRPRLTADIDVVIAVAPEEVGELISLVESHGWESDPEEMQLLVKGGLAHFWKPPSRLEGIGLDLVFVDSSFLELVVRRATPLSLAGAILPVATVEDLLVMKRSEAMKIKTKVKAGGGVMDPGFSN